MTEDHIREIWNKIQPGRPLPGWTLILAMTVAEEARRYALDDAIAACEPWTVANHVYVNGAIKCHNAIVELRRS